MTKRKALFTLFLLTVSILAQTFTTQLIPIAYGDGEDWLTGWTYRKSHVINGATEQQTNYQVMIEVRNDTGVDDGNSIFIDPSKVNANFSDIRFTTSDGVTKLDYWLESSDRMPYWADYEDNPILSPTGDEDNTVWASVLKNGSTWHMFYTYHDAVDKDQIGHATSPDGKVWTKDTANNPVFTKGAAGKFDDGAVWLSQVWIEGSTWHMLYAGVEDPGFAVIATGYATSTNGTTWTRQNGGDAVIEGTPATWDANQVEGSAVMKVDSTYYLWYTNFGTPRSVGLANSTNLIDWTKDENNPIFSNKNFCPAVFKRDSYYYILMTEYEETSGDGWSNMYLFRDTKPTFHVGDRVALGMTIPRGNESSGWKAYNLDVPFVATDDINRDSYTLTGDEFWCYYSGSSPAGAVSSIGLAIEPSIASAVTIPAIFCVEVSSLPVTTATIYTYYGKADAVSESNGSATFPFFDDFSGALSDKWTETGTGTAVNSGGECTITAGVTSYKGIQGKTSYGYNYSARARSRSLANSYQWYVSLSDYPTSANWIALLVDSANDFMSQTYDGAVESYTKGGGTTTYTVWEVSRINGSLVRTYVNDELHVTHTTQIPTADYPIDFQTYDQSSMKVDWALVRKRVDPEPEHGAWGSEESEPPSNVDPTVTSFVISDLSDGNTVFKTLWYRPVMVVDDSDGLSGIGTSYFSFETDYGWHNVSYNYQTDIYAVVTETGMIMVADGYTESSGTSLTIHFYLYLLESIDVDENVDVYCRVTDASGGDSDWSLEQLDYFNILDYVEDIGGSSGWTPSETPAEEPQEIWIDSDEDGIPNWDDPDIDGDGLPNEYDEDIDGDGIPNNLDPDPFIPEEKKERPILFSFKTPSGATINIINPLYYLKPYQKIIIPFLFLLLALMLYSIYRSRQKKSLDERVSTKITNLGGKMVKR